MITIWVSALWLATETIPDVRGFDHDGLDVRDGESDDGLHGAAVPRGFAVHERSAQEDEPRRVFAVRTPAACSALYSPRLCPAQVENAHVRPAQHGQQRQIDRRHGRLEVDRLGQLFHRAL